MEHLDNMRTMDSLRSPAWWCLNHWKKNHFGMDGQGYKLPVGSKAIEG